MEEQLTPELLERLREASELADDGRVDEAYAILAEEEASHPRDPTLLCMLGWVAGEMDATSGLAYDYYRRALAENPLDPTVLVPLGVGLARYDDPDAESVLRLAAVTAPGMLAARLQYGAYLGREGLLDSAVSELEAARAIDESDPRVPRELASAYLLVNQIGPALEELERAIELTDLDADVRVLYGLALVRAGRLEEAAEELHRASAEIPEDGAVQLLTSLACATQEWWDEAWDALARAEGAPFPPEPSVLREAEDALEAGTEPASDLLREQVAPAVLRERLAEGG
jgi:predicted Zn-dependent protease